MPEGKEVELADRLHSAAIHLLRRVAREDAVSGLGAAGLSALSVVVFAGPLSLGRLAEAERVRPPTMTRTVHGLEEAELVRREPAAGDGRVVNVRATPKGRRVLNAARRRRVANLAASIRMLGEDEREALEGTLDVLERIVRTPR
jgi:DNA-binding MarR family transcriptional regulator